MRVWVPSLTFPVALLLSATIAAWLSPSVLLSQDARGGRNLAKGILQTIPTEGMSGETFSSPRPLVELTVGQSDLNWDPAPNLFAKTNTLYEKASRVIFRRQIWNLEFSFKPMRMIQIDVPQPSGKMQRKLIWYLVYRVRYLGQESAPKSEVNDETKLATFPAVELKNFQYRRFFPLFILASQDKLPNNTQQKQYLDRIIPAAKTPILMREFPGKLPGTSSLAAEKLHNTVSIMMQNVPLSTARESHEVWGLITWEDVDPRIDYFSVFVKGLSNAFRFQDPDGGYQPGDPPGTGRKFSFKVLQLNFWRPGDTRLEHENEIRFGVPAEKDATRQQEMLKRYARVDSASGNQLDPEWPREQSPDQPDGDETLLRVDYLWTYR